MLQRSGHIVVIGAGMGGLSAAIRLALAGLAVTLVDAAAHAGGKMRTLPTPAGPVDAGPTVLTLRSVFDALFAQAGERLDDHLTLIPQTLLARHFWSDGATLDLYPDPEANARAIRDFAGIRAEAEFRAFARTARNLRTRFDAPVMQSGKPRLAAVTRAALGAPAALVSLAPALVPGRTLAGMLRAQFTDPRLRQLFGRYATYVGGAPHQSPAVLGLIWDVEQEGVWAVQGGMGNLARALADLAQRAGVVVRLNTRVTAIGQDARGAVDRVTLDDGSDLPCGAVVFNGDPAALGAGLLGDTVAPALPRSATHPRSLSARVWAFASAPRGVDLTLHNIFFADDEDAEFGPLAESRHPVDPSIYVCAQDRAGAPRLQGPERFEMILNAPPLPHKGAPDPTETDRCRSMTFDRLARFGLSFDPIPDTSALTTPQDFDRLFPGSQGSLYGLSPQAMTATFRRPVARTRIRGLYLAGGGTHPGAGVPMAALSGRHAAEAILHDRALT